MADHTPTVEQMAEELRPLAVTPETSTAVRVKVFRDDEGVLKVECSRPIPELKKVAAHLTKTQQRDVKYHIDYGRDVQGAIQRSQIPYQDWANAIGEAIIQADADAAGGSFEANAMKEPAYLAMGDTLFKLSPVELVKTNKALAATKKRAIEKSSAEAKRLISEGQLAADALIRNAAVIEKKAKDTLHRASRITPAPEWAVNGGIPCKWNGYSWAVELAINFRIEYFDVNFFDSRDNHKRYRWDAVYQPFVPIRLWVPVNTDGSYALTAIYVDHLSSQIPHISYSAACLSLGDSPRTIKSQEDLWALQTSIERCMKGVQLDSLRTYIGDWLPKFKHSVPADLYKALKGGDWRNAEKLAKSLDAATPVPVEEGETTWTA